MFAKNVAVLVCKISCWIVLTCKSADKSCIIPIWNKADILAVRLICIEEILLICNHTGLVLVHIPKREHGMCQLLLGQGIEHIALVLGRVCGFFQKVSAILTLLDSCIMASHNIVAAKLLCTVIQAVEFQIAVAVNTGVWSCSIFISSYKPVHDLFLEICSKVKNIIRDSQIVGYASCILHII